MEKIELVKQILCATPRIDELCRVIERKNLLRAYQSAFTDGDHTMEIMQTIIDKTFKIGQLQHLKAKIEKIVGNAPAHIKRVIELHFFNGQKPNDVAEQLHQSARTTFRTIDDAVHYVMWNFPDIETYKKYL